MLYSRSFWLLGAPRMVPVFDMLNHAEDPNTEYKGMAVPGLPLHVAPSPLMPVTHAMLNRSNIGAIG